jgi:rod shape-determining protein MreD
VGATGVVKPAIRVAFVLFSAAVLQRGLFSQLRIADAVVDVFLLLAIAAGISLGAERGAIFGFFAGLTLDLLLSTPLGLSALVYCLVGYGTGRLQGTVRRANRVWPLVLVATASVAAIGLYAVVAEVLGQANAISSQLVDDGGRGRRQRRGVPARPACRGLVVAGRAVLAGRAPMTPSLCEIGVSCATCCPTRRQFRSGRWVTD